MSINVDLFGFNSTIDLLKEFIKLRQSKKQEELETEDWKTLEKAYYLHLKWRFSYPKKVFNQQMYTGIAISIIVFVLIISGLVFAFWQLDTAITTGNLSNLKTDLSIETAGKISINSSIIGALVLIISLAFFYLYLKNVFKIQYPTPPHVGFEGTDISEKIKSKLFVDKKKDSLEINNQLLLSYLLNNDSLNGHCNKYWSKKSNNMDKRDTEDK